MEKSPEAFLTIGEMAERLGVKTHILRYWEEQFPMLSPLKRAGGRRLYRPADVALVQRINDLLHNQGYTIKGARSFLQKGGAATADLPAPVAPLAPVPPAGGQAAPDSAAIRRQLQAMRTRLSAALAAD